MKRFFRTLSAVALSVLAALSGAAQSWQWASAPAGLYNSTAAGAAVDSAGNAYSLLNVERGTAQLSPTVQLPRPGTYVVKCSAFGQWQWAIPVDTTNALTANALVVDINGNITVAGFVAAPAQIGIDSLAPTGNTPDAFVARLSATGQWQWAIQSQGSRIANIRPTDVSLGLTGDVWLTGTFSDTATFGTSILRSSSGTRYPMPFIVAVSPNGQWRDAWLIDIGTTGACTARALAADANSVYVCGDWGGTISFGSISMTWPPGATNRRVAFIAKLTPGVGWAWAKQWGTRNTQAATSVVVEPTTGDAIVGGHFNTSVTLGSLPPLSAAPPVGAAGLVARLRAVDGQWLWAAKTNGPGQGGPFVQHLALDSAGTLYAAGGWRDGAVTFGSTTITPPPSQWFAYVAAADPTNGQWQRAWQSSYLAGPLYLGGLAAGPAGHVLLAGAFPQSGVNFSFFQLASNPLATTSTAFCAYLRDDLSTGLTESADGTTIVNLWPNPATATATLTRTTSEAAQGFIYDAIGRQVRMFLLAAGQRSVTLDVGALPAGCYTVRCGARARRLAVAAP